VGVVIPCYKVKKTVGDVINNIPANVHKIICVNDASPDGIKDVLETIAHNNDRVIIINHDKNQGVGGAVKSGYREAISHNLDVVVKIDADGQMNPKFIPSLIEPILLGRADYTKGNRFFDIESVRPMPVVRLLGNAGLSFFSKLSTGYWSLFDPTNGYTAINVAVLKYLPLSKLSNRYFFETDLLFRLSTVRAKVMDIPMQAFYGEEKSNLNSFQALLTFPFLHLRNFSKRILYNYFFRNFSIASVNLVIGIILVVFGGWYGIYNWTQSFLANTTTPAGVVMLAALPIILGSQALLNFLSFDIYNEPNEPISNHISNNINLSVFRE
jgi:dolichol-phosphate mannosyltransferase